jgi:hypothetical protein
VERSDTHRINMAWSTGAEVFAKQLNHADRLSEKPRGGEIVVS